MVANYDISTTQNQSVEPSQTNKETVKPILWAVEKFPQEFKPETK